MVKAFLVSNLNEDLCSSYLIGILRTCVNINMVVTATVMFPTFSYKPNNHSRIFLINDQANLPCLKLLIKAWKMVNSYKFSICYTYPWNVYRHLNGKHHRWSYVNHSELHARTSYKSIDAIKILKSHLLDISPRWNEKPNTTCRQLCLIGPYELWTCLSDKKDHSFHHEDR